MPPTTGYVPNFVGMVYTNEIKWICLVLAHLNVKFQIEMFLCLRVMCCCFWLNLCWPLAIVFDRFPASSPVSAQEFGYGVLTNQSWTKGLIQESSQKVKDGQGFDLGISTPLRKADPSTRPHCCGSAFFLQRPPGHSSDIDLCRAKIFKSDTTAWEAWNCRERLQSKVPAIIYTYIYIYNNLYHV